MGIQNIGLGILINRGQQITYHQVVRVFHHDLDVSVRVFNLIINVD